MGILTIALAAGACNRTEPTAAAAAPSTNATAGATDSKPSGSERVEATAVREVTIPAGTVLPITLDTTVGSDISRVEQPVAAHLTRPLVIGGHTVLAAGSRVAGVVADATRSGKVKGRAHVAVRFDSLTPGGESERYRIDAPAVGRTAAATKKKDALEIGGGAAGGALIGALVGGKKGAAIGTAAGGGAGTAVVLSTRGEEVHMPKGTALTLRLVEPVTIRVRG
jgi:hypothetical protein